MKPTEVFNVIDRPSLLSLRQQCIAPYLDEDGLLTVWMSIPESAFQALTAHGQLLCPAHLSDPDPCFQMAYAWMADCMAEVGLERPAADVNPLWCWIHAGTEDRKPTDDMIGREHYLLTLRLDPARVLASDFHFWHYPLNYWPLTRSSQTSDDYEAYLSALGHNYFRTKPLPTPHHETIIASWRQIFDLTFHQDDEEPEPFADRRIQGVFWSANANDIIAIEPPGRIIVKQNTEHMGDQANA